MPKDENYLAKAAAYMYAEAKLTQSQIAERLDVGGQSRVSKLLAIAREKKWLFDEPRFDLDKAEVDEAMLAQIKLQCHPYLNDLEKKLDPSMAVKQLGVRGLRTQDIRIISTGEANTDPEGYDRRLRLFGRASAERVAALVADVKVTGVSWGKTIRFLCEYIEDAFENKAKNRTGGSKTVFVPVVGESLNSPNARVAASSLVAEFHRAVKGDSDALSFGAVASRIPAEFEPGDNSPIRRFFSYDAGYRRVFGKNNTDHESEELLVNQMDAVITSVGTASPEVRDPYLSDTEDLLKIGRDELLRLSIGNISGYFLPKPFPEAEERVAEVNGRWTGITEEHLRRCSIRCTASGSPGVIVLAIGKAKSDIVRECASRGLINQLIIDEDLAKSLVGLK